MDTRKEFVVYLSSTLADLRAERELALKTIAEVGVVKTSYRPNEQRAVQACTDDVRASHLYVGILGQRYGWVPPPGEADPAAKSITELEYEACNRPGEAPIPRLMFIKPTDAEGGIAQDHIDAISHPQTAQRMAAFIKRANAEQTAYLYKDLNDFGAKLFRGVWEQSEKFHRADAPGGGLFDQRSRSMTPVALACVPGTDEAARESIAAYASPRLLPFALSPDDPRYLATLDAALARPPGGSPAAAAGGGAQLAALLLTPASLARLTQGHRPAMVGAALAMLKDRTGCAPLLACGVERAQLPPGWDADLIDLPADALAEGRGAAELQRTLDAVYDRLRALEPRLTHEPRLTLPYMVIAPTLAQAQSLGDPSGHGFDGFSPDIARSVRRAEFDRISSAARRANPAWPDAVYADSREGWQCFGPGSPSADAIVRSAVARINHAGDGTRERRQLRSARVIPRRYRLDEFLTDQWGSRAAVLAVRDSGCLFFVDELALLHPELRAAADTLLAGGRSAVVSVSPCDPAHTRIDELLGDFSFLRVGTLVSRFKTELDPRCELALNSLGRIERWLRVVLPELVGGDEQQSKPALLEEATQFFAGSTRARVGA